MAEPEPDRNDGDPVGRRYLAPSEQLVARGVPDLDVDRHRRRQLDVDLVGAEGLLPVVPLDDVPGAARDELSEGAPGQRVEANDPEAAAGAVGISLRYLHALFHSDGTTGWRWTTRRRLEQARTVLANPSQAHLSVTHVAFTVGFADLAHFSRAF